MVDSSSCHSDTFLVSRPLCSLRNYGLALVMSFSYSCKGDGIFQTVCKMARIIKRTTQSKMSTLKGDRNRKHIFIPQSLSPHNCSKRLFQRTCNVCLYSRGVPSSFKDSKQSLTKHLTPLEKQKGGECLTHYTIDSKVEDEFHFIFTILFFIKYVFYNSLYFYIFLLRISNYKGPN